MFCWKCGANNPNDNNFCGKCGSPLHRPEAAETGGEKPLPVAPEKPETPLSMRPHHEEPIPPAELGTPRPNPLLGETRVIRETPIASSTSVEAAPPPQSSSTRVYGPSFLGLNDGPSDEGSDYLFDEEPQRSASPVAWLLLLVLVGLGAYVFLHWSSVRAAAGSYAQKYGLIQKSQPAPEVATNSPSSISTTNAAGQNSNPDEAATDSTDQQANEAKNASDNAADSTASGEAPEKQAESANDENQSAAKGTSADKSGASRSSKTVEKPESDEGSASAAATAPQRKKTTDESANEAKPEVKERKSKTEDTSTEPATPAVTYDRHKLELAQKYLQGKGVEQNCDLGVRLLRSAADEPNPDAKIQMGALYLTGHCVQRDQAQAYRWFSQAYSLDPGNSWVEKNLTEIWAQMTPEERRRAEH